MIKRVEKTMREHGMLENKSILVGLSGGADSAALMHVLVRLSEKYGFKVCAAHVNHGLRGDDADNDELFSKEFAQKLGIDFFSHHADVRGYAAQRCLSEELAGREIRYDFFRRLMDENGIACTATAHHKNDNAETILMNFMRGSGVKGLCGIPYTRGRIIRPMLDVTREETETYCRENGIEYVTDKTNLETVYTRNKVRHIIIPGIEKEINPSFIDTVTKNSALMSVDEDYLSGVAASFYTDNFKDNSIDAKKLSSAHRAISQRVIRLMIENACGTADVSSVVTASVLELARKNRTGSECDIARGARAAVLYGRLYIRTEVAETDGFEYKLKIGESRYIPETGYTIHVENADKLENDGAQYFSLPREGCSICIRSRRAGDKFRPSGMMGTKKVKDFMINEKIPKDERGRVGIVTFDHEIAWIVPYRRDERFRFHKNGVKIRLEY